MGVVKYLLAQTGFFPRFERDVRDIVEVAELIYAIQSSPKNRNVLYVRLKRWDNVNSEKIKKMFKNNGVILKQHYSLYFGEHVLQVRDRGQQFVLDVMDVCKDSSNFESIKKRREAEIRSERSKKVTAFFRRHR